MRTLNKFKNANAHFVRTDAAPVLKALDLRAMIYKILIFVVVLFLIYAAFSLGLKSGFKSRETFDVALITSIAEHQAECIKAGDEICIAKSNEIILSSLNLISEDWPLESLELQMPEQIESIE